MLPHLLQADVAILEEPEHLTWFHHGRRYTEKFRHVLGILHTNYIGKLRSGNHTASCAYEAAYHGMHQSAQTRILMSAPLYAKTCKLQEPQALPLS